MGGDRVSPLIAIPDEESSSSSEQEFSEPSLGLPSRARSYVLSPNLEDGTVNAHHGFVPGGLDDEDDRVSSSNKGTETEQRRRRKIYKEVLQSYDELRRRSENLEEAKSKIMSYSAGSWIEKVGGMKLDDYNVPKTTSLLLIGPRGAGKSSLINRISRVFENGDTFASERAQVSYNLSCGDGTLFLSEYMIPRGSTSFCLYDTRSLCDDSSENMEMLKNWMTKGVRHGELVIRDSDTSSLKTIMKCKARQSGGHCASELRRVNFIIFVVNGLSILKSMDSNEEATTRYVQLIASSFNCPYLSFKDDKPVVVVTHGDLLSLSDRARVCVYLGELLGIPPMKQIFDIPESCDPVTELTFVDMLQYALEHADRNLPAKGWSRGKVCQVSLPACLFMLIVIGIAIISVHVYHGHAPSACLHGSSGNSQSNTGIDWHSIRHLWLGSDFDY